jgi:hypothetical protein
MATTLSAEKAASVVTTAFLLVASGMIKVCVHQVNLSLRSNHHQL